MVEQNVNLEILVVGSDDGINTYEVRRKLGSEGGKALIVELYPTLTTDRAECMDLSTMHLMNHIAELGWNDVRVVNLYSKVFGEKPLTSDLKDAENSLTYIEKILNEDDIKEYDIVVAWGSALASHKPTIKIKIDILSLIKEKGLIDRTKCISTDGLYVEETYGVHPLFLGLHYGKDEWNLVDYPLEAEFEKLENVLGVDYKLEPIAKKRRKSNVSKAKDCA